MDRNEKGAKHGWLAISFEKIYFDPQTLKIMQIIQFWYLNIFQI
jgi:hypothetical protein